VRQCILVRRDKKFLPLETAQAVFAYIKKLLDAAGYPPEDGWAPVHELMTPAAFQSHSRDYYEAQRNKGRSGFAPFWSPL
jgi:ABC-type glycerol-3-phosphate transport system substrate-binding protein